MIKEDFKQQLEQRKPWVKINNIEDHNDYLLYEEAIDLSHPDNPFIVITHE